MTELWLIRHGQTEWNVQGRYQGQADKPLNQTGLEQANALAESLVDQVFTAIYSSDLMRARQTAEVIAKCLRLELHVDARLREIHQGEWEGKLVTDLARLYSVEMAARQENPVEARAPGGESVAEVAARVWAAADDIARSHLDGRILVVSHGLALATLISRGRHIPLERVYSIIPENAASTVIEWPPNINEPAQVTASR